MDPRDCTESLTMGVAILLVVIVAIVWTLTGCAVNPCVKPVVNLPEPVLPEVQADELQCLSDSAYVRLADRDLILQSALLQCKEALSEVTE